MPIIRANAGFRNTKYARIDGENPDVFIGSSLSVIGLWVFFLRQRFSDSVAQALPWYWSEDLRPADDEDGSPLPEGSPRKIQIASAYNTEQAIRDYRPSIFVGRGGRPISPMKTVVDNFVGEVKTTGFRAFYIMTQMPITIEIKSENAGECSVLGDTVWSFVLATRDIARKDFGFHEVSEPTLGDTIPNAKDKEIWETSVTFEVQFDQRWGVTPIAPKLREILTTITSKNNSSTDDYLARLALRDDVGT